MIYSIPEGLTAIHCERTTINEARAAGLLDPGDFAWAPDTAVVYAYEFEFHGIKVNGGSVVTQLADSETLNQFARSAASCLHAACDALWYEMNSHSPADPGSRPLFA